ALSGYMRTGRGDEDIHLPFEHVVSSGSVVAFAEDDLAGFEVTFYYCAFVQLQEGAGDALEYRQRQKFTNIYGNVTLQPLKVLAKDLLVRERTGRTRNHAFSAGDTGRAAHRLVSIEADGCMVALALASDDKVVADLCTAANTTVTEN